MVNQAVSCDVGNSLQEGGSDVWTWSVRKDLVMSVLLPVPKISCLATDVALITCTGYFWIINFWRMYAV